jgi:hypothetical protein
MLRRSIFSLPSSSSRSVVFFNMTKLINSTPSSTVANIPTLQAQVANYHWRTSSTTIMHKPAPGEKTARELHEERLRARVEEHKNRYHPTARQMFLGILAVTFFFFFMIITGGTFVTKHGMMAQRREF